jgi:type VI secretion system protein ImpC
MLWGNSAVVAGLLLGLTWSQQGSAMKPGSVLTIGERPFYCYTDSDGDETPLPCTERMLSSKMAELVLKYRFMPMLSMKGRPEVRLGGLVSLTGKPLAGSWQPVAAASKAAEPEPEPAEAAADAEEPAAEETPAESAEETTQASEASAETPASDPELDKLLASLNEETAPAQPPPETPPGEEAEQPMDPDLAALLKDLG